MRNLFRNRTLLKTVTRRFWTIFACTFLLVDVIAWFRHTAESSKVTFFHPDFFYFSIATFTAGLPVLLSISLLVVLARMQRSGEMDMLRTYGIPYERIVRLLSHSAKLLFVVLVIAKELLVPHVRWDIVRAVNPGRPERFTPMVMKSGGRDIYMKVSGDYRCISECYVWGENDWSRRTDIRFREGQWLSRGGREIDLPGPGEMILYDPRSLEFLSAGELLSLASRGPLRRAFFRTLALEHASSVVFLYFLLVALCRIFVRRKRNALHILGASSVFLLAAHVTLFGVRHVAGSLESLWLQSVVSFAPALVLLCALSVGRLRQGGCSVTR